MWLAGIVSWAKPVCRLNLAGRRFLNPDYRVAVGEAFAGRPAMDGHLRDAEPVSESAMSKTGRAEIFGKGHALKIPNWYSIASPKYTIPVFDGSIVSGYQFGMNTLKDLREKAELTQSQLAELASTSQPQIRRLENGERELTVAWAERLAGPLKTTPVKILFPNIEIDHPANAAERLRSALTAYGVHPDDMSRIMKVIDGFVDDVDDDERELSDRAQPEPANHRREPAPKGKRVPQSSS